MSDSVKNKEEFQKKCMELVQQEEEEFSSTLPIPAFVAGAPNINHPVFKKMYEENKKILSGEKKGKLNIY